MLSLAHRLRHLGEKNPHRQLWACDIDPAACRQTKEVSGIPDDHVWSADFLSLVAIDGVQGRKFDSVVGNPPYVSLHRMPLDQRERALAAARRLNLTIGGRASLWAYFLAASVHAVRPGGRVAFILPESLLHAEYALAMVRTFARSFKRCTLVSLRERCFVPDGAAERVVVLLAEEFTATPQSTEIALRECITAEDAVRFITALRDEQAGALPALNGHAVPHLLPATSEPMVELSATPCSHTFGSFADIKIGVVTGADHYFLLTELERKERKLRSAWLTPLLPRFQACKTFAFRSTDWKKLRDRGEKCWLLSPPADVNSAALRGYLGKFPIQELEENRTFTKRPLWYAPVLGRKAHAFLRYMGASGPRIAFARFQVTCTNIIHRVYFEKGISALKRKAIILSMHSSYSQLSAEFEGRAYGSGVLKLEPSEGRRLRLLLPPVLNRAEIDQCFEVANCHLGEGRAAAATAVVDDWLYQAIPNLEACLPRARLRAVLATTVQRRLGYPQHFVNAEGRRNGSIDSALGERSRPASRSKMQNGA